MSESAAHAVEIRDLVKTYGRVRAVDNLSMTVPRGSVFGLLGHNGAGKSTTFGVLCGWLRADAGASLVLGVPSAKAASLRGRVVALPQDASFAPEMPIVRQLMHYARLQGVTASEAERTATRALERVGL
ncbi:MAG: ABC-2 type transport system ATP-binding protein, partial [Flavobacteriales bacterium]